jgi:hypothetical protein
MGQSGVKHETAVFAQSSRLKAESKNKQVQGARSTVQGQHMGWDSF